MKTTTEFSWEKLPDSYESFIKEANEKMYEPEFAAALFITALKFFMQDRDEGAKILNLLTYNKEDGNVLYFSRLMQLVGKYPYIGDSYFAGATPDNGYNVSGKYTVTVKSDNAKGLRKDMKTVYVGCNGSGNYRPITLIRIDESKADKYCKLIKPENDMWFVSDFVSILLDIKPLI